MGNTASGSADKTFPKTTILSITTHGEIRLNSEINSVIKYDRDGIRTVLPTFVVNPRIIEFYKFNAVVPDVLSYVEGDDEPIDIKEIERISRGKGGYEAFDLIVGEDVATVNRDIRDAIAATPGIDRNVGSLAKELGKRVTSDIATVLDKITNSKAKLERKKKNKEELTETDNNNFYYYTNFINNAAKGSKMVNCLETGRKMINKTYCLLPENMAPTSEDWAITSMNDPFNVRKEIFDEVYNNAAGVSRSSSRTGRRSITLEQIVNYLADNGVERLIIVDLTCCPILGPYIDDPNVADTEYKGRIARQVRRDVLGNIGYGGKKSRRSRRSRRTRRYKK
jgi:hypothetical protein